MDKKGGKLGAENTGISMQLVFVCRSRLGRSKSATISDKYSDHKSTLFR
jgi:hypothetical protein